MSPAQISLVEWRPNPAPDASEQSRQLARVGGRIAELVLDFCRRHVGEQFHLEELNGHVLAHELVAPDSPRRILGQLRRAGQVDVQLLNRSASLYRVVRA